MEIPDLRVESIRIRPATKYIIEITRPGDHISDGHAVGWMDMDKEVKCEECKKYGKWMEPSTEETCWSEDGEHMSYGYPWTVYRGANRVQSRERGQKKRLLIPCMGCARENGFYWGYSYHSRIRRWVPIRCNGMQKCGDEYSDHEIVLESILQKYEEMQYDKKIDIKEHAGNIINEVLHIMIIEERTNISNSQRFPPWTKRHQVDLEIGEYRDTSVYQRDLISYLKYLKDAWILWSNIHLPDDRTVMEESDEIELNLFNRLFIVNREGFDWVNTFIDGYDEERRDQMRMGYEIALELEGRKDIKMICRKISEIVDDIMEKGGGMKEGDYKGIMEGLQEIHNQ